MAKKFNTELIIARPSIVVGHSQFGCKISGSIFFAFRAVDKLGMIAWPHDYKIDVVSVDWVVDVVETLLFKTRLQQNVYHLSAGDKSSTWSNLSTAFQSCKNQGRVGCQNCKSNNCWPHYELVTLKEFHNRKSERFSSALGCCPRSISYALKLYSNYSMMNVVFDNSQLLSEGLEPPMPLHQYLPKCLEIPGNVCISQQLAEDFR